MKKNFECCRLFLRAVAFLTTIFFFTTSVSWAEIPSSSLSHPFAELSKVQFPANVGQLKTFHQGTRDRFIIHVQDAHVNEEAQLNIARILDYFAARAGLNLINVEGAEGELYTELFSFFPDESVRRETAGYFLRQGRLSGPEYLAIVRRRNLQLFGVEQKALYERNKTAYVEALNFKSRDEAALAELYKTLRALSRFMLTPEALDFVNRRLEWQSGEPSALLGYLTYLLQTAEKHEVPMEKYAALKKIQSGQKPDQTDFDLFAQLHDLEEAVKNKVIVREEARQLEHFWKVCETLQKMFDFSLTKEDAEFYLAHRRDFQSRILRNYLEPRMKKYRFAEPELPAIEVLDHDLRRIERFYLAALQRDKVLIQNALTKMEKEGQKVAALVTGGFHTPGMEKYLKEQGYSFITVTPAISKTFDAEKERLLYEAGLIGKPVSPVQKMIETAFAARKTTRLNDPRFQLAIEKLVPMRGGELTPDGKFYVSQSMIGSLMGKNSALTLELLRVAARNRRVPLAFIDPYEGAVYDFPNRQLRIPADQDRDLVVTEEMPGKVSEVKAGRISATLVFPGGKRRFMAFLPKGTRSESRSVAVLAPVQVKYRGVMIPAERNDNYDPGYLKNIFHHREFRSSLYKHFPDGTQFGIRAFWVLEDGSKVEKLKWGMNWKKRVYTLVSYDKQNPTAKRKYYGFEVDEHGNITRYREFSNHFNQLHSAVDVNAVAEKHGIQLEPYQKAKVKVVKTSKKETVYKISSPTQAQPAVTMRVRKITPSNQNPFWATLRGEISKTMLNEKPFALHITTGFQWPAVKFRAPKINLGWLKSAGQKIGHFFGRAWKGANRFLDQIARDLESWWTEMTKPRPKKRAASPVPAIPVPPSSVPVRTDDYEPAFLGTDDPPTVNWESGEETVENEIVTDEEVRARIGALSDVGREILRLSLMKVREPEEFERTGRERAATLYRQIKQHKISINRKELKAIPEIVETLLRSELRCGNASIMGIVRTDSDVEKYLDRFGESIAITEARGKISLGFYGVMEAFDGKKVILHEKYIVFKRQEAQDAYRQFVKKVKRAHKKLGKAYEFKIGIHVRYPTGGRLESDATVEKIREGAHPHIWLKRKGKLNAVGHNGDFDYIMHKGEKYDNDFIGWTLAKIHGVENNTTGDSPKLPGLMDLYIAQGDMDRARDYAIHEAVVDRFEDYFGGTHPQNLDEARRARNTVATATQKEQLSAFLVKAFKKYAGHRLDEKGRLNTFDFNPEELIGLETSMQRELRQLAEYNVPEAKMLFDKWGEEKAHLFVSKALRGYVQNDEYTVWKLLLPRFRGTAGINSYSSDNAHSFVAWSLGQSIYIGIGEKNGELQLGSFSERNAARVQGYDFIIDLDLMGEIASVSHDGKKVNLKIYSMIQNHELTESEIEARKIPVKTFKSLTDEEKRDPNAMEQRKLPYYFEVTEKEWAGKRTVEVPEPHNPKVAANMATVLFRSVIGRRISDAVRERIGKHDLDDALEAWGLTQGNTFLAQHNGHEHADSYHRITGRFFAEVLRREILNSLAEKPFVDEVIKSAHTIASELVNDKKDKIPSHQLDDKIQKAAFELLDRLFLEGNKAVLFLNAAYERALEKFNKINSQKLFSQISSVANMPIGVQSSRQLALLYARYLDPIKPQADGPDLVLAGKEKNESLLSEWMENWLKKKLPGLRVAYLEPNQIVEEAARFTRSEDDASQELKALDVEGLKTRLGLTNPYVFAFIASESGQTFASSMSTPVLKRLIPDVFVMTADINSPAAREVGADHTFLVRVDWSPSEMHIAATGVTRLNLLELDLYLAEMIARKFPAERLFDRKYELKDIADLREEKEALLESSVPRITGYAPQGPLKSQALPGYRALVEEGKSLGRRVNEPLTVRILTATYVAATVALVKYGVSILPLFELIHQKMAPLLGFLPSTVLAADLLFALVAAVYGTVLLIFISKLILSLISSKHPLQEGTAAKLFVRSTAFNALLLSLVYAPGVLDAGFYIFMGMYAALVLRFIIKKFDKNARSIQDHTGPKKVVIVSKHRAVAKLWEIALRKMFNQAFGDQAIFVWSDDNYRVLDEHAADRSTWIILLERDGRIADQANNENASSMIGKQNNTILSLLAPLAHLFGIPLSGAYILSVGANPNGSPKAVQKHIAVDSETHAPATISKRRIVQEMHGDMIDAFKEWLYGSVLFPEIARTVATPVWYRPWSYYTTWQWHRTHTGTGIQTTAAPYGGDVIIPHLRSLTKLVSVIGQSPKAAPVIVETPEPLHSYNAFQNVGDSVHEVFRNGRVDEEEIVDVEEYNGELGEDESEIEVDSLFGDLLESTISKRERSEVRNLRFPNERLDAVSSNGHTNGHTNGHANGHTNGEVSSPPRITEFAHARQILFGNDYKAIAPRVSELKPSPAEAPDRSWFERDRAVLFKEDEGEPDFVAAVTETARLRQDILEQALNWVALSGAQPATAHAQRELIFNYHAPTQSDALVNAVLNKASQYSGLHVVFYRDAETSDAKWAALKAAYSMRVRVLFSDKSEHADLNTLIRDRLRTRPRLSRKDVAQVIYPHMQLPSKQRVIQNGLVGALALSNELIVMGAPQPLPGLHVIRLVEKLAHLIRAEARTRTSA